MNEELAAVAGLVDDMSEYLDWLETRRSELAHELALLCIEEDDEMRNREPNPEILVAERGMHMSHDPDWRAYVSDYYEQVAA